MSEQEEGNVVPDPVPELASTREFWDANPCGVHAGYEAQVQQRYAMEPYLPALLRRIGAAHANILEIGCGQGVDSTLLCAAMPAGGSYIGIDYSPASVDVARRNADYVDGTLTVTPEYRVGNAEHLDFDDNHFDAVYSMGVLHHTANDLKAINEALRVLKPGGKAYIFLYRRPSLKVGVAKMLRALQAGLDMLLGTDRCIYGWLKRQGTHSRLFGTMFHECFGVPHMKWYNRQEIESAFQGYSRIETESYGPNFGRLYRCGDDPNPFGFFWVVEATK
ncbi:MAG: class I SAM-dependent methyltransferase [Alphaproteobacteria bacterium]